MFLWEWVALPASTQSCLIPDCSLCSLLFILNFQDSLSHLYSSQQPRLCTLYIVLKPKMDPDGFEDWWSKKHIEMILLAFVLVFLLCHIMIHYIHLQSLSCNLSWIITIFWIWTILIDMQINYKPQIFQPSLVWRLILESPFSATFVGFLSAGGARESAFWEPWCRPCST